MIGHIDVERIGEEAVRNADRKTEPTCSKMEQVDKDINVRSKDEPSMEEFIQGMKNLQIEVKSEPQTCETCKYNEEMWYTTICDGCCRGNSHHEPKDESQTKRSEE